MQLVSLARFAKLAGLNRSSVSRAVDKDHLPVDPGSGKIDLDDERVRFYAESAKFHSYNHIPFESRLIRHPESLPRTNASVPLAAPAPAPAPVVVPPSERMPYPALDAAVIDPRSPATMDVLDGLDDPHRIALVERSAVVNLVSALSTRPHARARR